jgi:hypothetical protein
MSKGNSGRSRIVLTKNSVISKCLVGVSVGQAADVKIAGLIEHCNTAVLQRDSHSLVELLGLHPETPVEELIAVINALRENPNASDVEMVQVIENTGVWGWIQRSADAATAVQGVIALAKSAVGLTALL